uniref:Integrase catalytic domain-containing protein n=1 Tax=Strongyloides papillosus TaxID=174720 RepID=A0A0N5CCY4_STREA
MRRYSTRSTCNQNLQGLTLSEQFEEIQRQAMEDANNMRPRVQLNNQTIPENDNLSNEERQTPRLNENGIPRNDNLGNERNQNLRPNDDNRDDDPNLNLRPNDDDIPSIPSDGSQNDGTGNDSENDYRSDDRLNRFTVSDKRSKIGRTPLRTVNRRQKVVSDKLLMMEEKINQIEDNLNSVKEELKNSFKESINQMQQQFSIMMKDMMKHHQKYGDTENTNKSPTSFTIQTSPIQVEKTTHADQKITASEFTIKLENFDGDKKISFDTWMEKFEIFVEENHIPPHKHFKILKYHLGEDPSSAIRDCKDFDEAVKILQENYNGEVSIATANSLLNSIKRKRVRTLDDIKKYTPTIEEAYKALYKVKQARMTHQINFLKDMLSPELQLHFHGTTTNDWPLFLCQVKDKITLLKKAKEDQEFGDKIRKKKESKDNAKKERKCTFEGCKYPNSHETKDCRFKKAEFEKKTLLCIIVDKGKVKKVENKSDKDDEGLTIIRGKINNIDAKVAIDTGSNVSILNSNWINKLNLQVDEGNESTIDNLNSKSTLKRCKGEIIITLNEVDFKLNNPHVFVNNEHTFDLLLGSDILMRTKGFYISYDDNKSIKFKLLKNDKIKCFMAKRGRPRKKPPTTDDDKEKIDLPSIKESAETDPLKKRRELLNEIFRLSHDQHGHFGYKKTYQLIKDRMVDDKLQVNDTVLNDWEDDLKIYIKSCRECQLRNLNMKRHGKDQTVKMEAPNLHISVDIIGPLNQKSYQNHKYILSKMDDFSRYTYAVPIADYHFGTISKELLHYFCLFGYPKVIKSDQGGNFLSDDLNQWLSSLNITHEYTKAYHKKGNSLVERAHRWLEDGIAKSSRNNPTHWNEYIDRVTFAYNSTQNETSGRSPFSCMFLRDPVIPLDNHLHTYSVGLHDKSNDLYELYKIAAETHFDTNQFIEGTRNKENQKTTDNRLPEFKKNDLILIRRPDNKPKVASKFSYKYKGPYRVIRQEGNNVIYKMSGRGKEISDNVENVKRYYQRDENPEGTSDSKEKEEKDYISLEKKKDLIPSRDKIPRSNKRQKAKRG